MDGFIGIDLGTSGCRACAINQQGDILAEARTGLPASKMPKPGHVEQTPADWWQATLAVLDQLFAKRLFTPKAISIDGTSSTLLVCTQQGRPLTPGLMYNDSRAVEPSQQLRHIAPPDSAVHSASSALAKLLYLAAQQAFQPTGRALHQADWIAGMLSGQFGVADENNALKLGYDPVQRRWPDWFAQLADIQPLLPGVVPVGTMLGNLDATLLRRWQCAQPVQIIAGTTDSNAAAIAAGIRQKGDAVTSLGSTLVVKILSDQPLFCAEYGIYSHRLYQHWLLGGASNSGGQVLANYFRPEQITQLSQQIDPQTTTGLNYYPLGRPGERFPLNDPALQPRLSPRPQDDALFLHGLLEGIANIERCGYQLLHELGAPYPQQVISTGGGAQNITWQKMRSRLLKVPVTQVEHAGAAYGSALIAAQKAFTLHTAPPAQPVTGSPPSPNHYQTIWHSLYRSPTRCRRPGEFWRPLVGL